MLKIELKVECTILIMNVETILSCLFKKTLRKSQAQFREKLRKLRLRQNDSFLIKNVHYFIAFIFT